VETQVGETEQGDEPPKVGRLPPDLEQLDDEELSEHLSELVREDGQVDMNELQIGARSGVVYLEGAVPSESEHDVLLNILTDVAGIQEIVDNLDVQRLAWERDNRSKVEPAQERQPGQIPDQEPYGGTEDVNLSKEEGVTYKPPDNPPRRTKPLLTDRLATIRAIAVGACFNPREGVVYVAQPPLLLFVQSLKHAAIALLLRFLL
jgi:hypothetical protein